MDQVHLQDCAYGVVKGLVELGMFWGVQGIQELSQQLRTMETVQESYQESQAEIVQEEYSPHLHRNQASLGSNVMC